VNRSMANVTAVISGAPVAHRRGRCRPSRCRTR
jgi:hypothetical protein